jgi:hypothetical protein
MKKIIFLVCILGLTTAFASAQTSFGVEGGLSLASQTSRTAGAKYTTNIVAGVAAGVFAKMPMAADIVFRPALRYEGKGGSGQDGSGYRLKTRLNYITLPLDVLYQAPIAQGGYWNVGLGPYLGYGVSGKRSGGSSTAVNAGDPFKPDQGSLKRFDFGGDVHLGYESPSGFLIGLSTELGILNIAKGGDSRNAYRNTSFDILVGYVFPSR